jgi:hypothetical protein
MSVTFAECGIEQKFSNGIGFAGMVKITVRKSSAVAKKPPSATGRENRVCEEEQLYLMTGGLAAHLDNCGSNGGHARFILKSQPLVTDRLRRYVELVSTDHNTHAERRLLFRRYADRLIINPLLTRRLVSFQASKQRPFYRWLKYKEAFSPELVDYLLEGAALRRSSGIEVLDPFAGTGTVLSRAVARKWNATGIELLPVGASSLKARLVADRVDLMNFSRALDRFSNIDWGVSDPEWQFPHLAITKSAFPARTEKEMSAYAAFLRTIRDGDVHYLFWFAALSVLEEVSFTRKDGQYLRWDYRSGRKLAKHFDKGPVPPFSSVVRQRLREFQFDLQQRNGGNFSEYARVIEGSCLLELPKLSGESVDLVITSPPYCNRYDYTRTYALELAFCGFSDEQVRALRQTLLSATVENKSKRNALRNYYAELGANRRSLQVERAFDRQAALHEALQLLCQARDRGELSNKNVPMLVENYFLEMTYVVFEIARLLRKGGRAFVVNDNVRYHGQEIPVDLVLSSLAETAGLTTDCIWVLPRGKGNSSQQMGRWGRHELRKCVYCWRKP